MNLSAVFILATGCHYFTIEIDININSILICSSPSLLACGILFIPPTVFKTSSVISVAIFCLAESCFIYRAFSSHMFSNFIKAGYQIPLASQWLFRLTSIEIIKMHNSILSWFLSFSFLLYYLLRKSFFRLVGVNKKLLLFKKTLFI